MEGDGLLFLEALVELVALEHLRHGEVGGEANHALEAEFVEPLGVEADFGLVAVENAEDLVSVGFRVLIDLLAGHRLAGDVAAGRIADERGEVANEEDDLMAEVLKVLELAHEHGVAEVKVGRGGIEAGLNAQRRAGLARFFEALAEIGDADDFRSAFFEQVELLIDRKKAGHGCSQYKVSRSDGG